MRDRSRIRKDAFLTLDCGIPTVLPEEPKPPTPNRKYQTADIRAGMMLCGGVHFTPLQERKPVKYGEPNFAAVSDKLDDVRERLEGVRDLMRRLKGGKS